ncbi:hypothetical protein HPB50_003329 [Hyalomma asiaticum]|uniref:Uncharacterized protein n=1 Tax=Hyalomma asiaticum TaxID=266040 RepID=A0ACB7S6U7_HYAAI|nr:hypothetical protein HPB50_003329 [Hyalomma asiaticum]
MLTKPFVFVVQVVATVFGTKAAEYESVLTDPSHDRKDLHGVEVPLRGHRCLIGGAVLSLVSTPTHAPTSVTSAASDLPMAIRSCVPPSNFSGPGSGSLGEMLTKPFVFVVQNVDVFWNPLLLRMSLFPHPSHNCPAPPDGTVRYEILIIDGLRPLTSASWTLRSPSAHGTCTTSASPTGHF